MAFLDFLDIFLGLGFILYVSIPSMAHADNLALFVGFLCIILSRYGGGFATVPASLADLFGTQMVGAIHGRLLTAWAAAGVLAGLVLVGVLCNTWAAVGIPLMLGVWITLQKAAVLFK